MKLIKNRKSFFIIFIILVPLLLFIIYTAIKYDKDKRIDPLLQEHIKHLEISYRQGVDRFDMIAENVYLSLQNDDVFLDILSKAVNASQDERDKLRSQMYKHLEDEYRKLKMLDVMQVHLVLPDNISFLRMHKPSKYGDDLSSVRYSIKSVNELNIHAHGFEAGKTIHGFREVFSVYLEGEHIGAVDIAFSSKVLQSYTMRASGIHTHFLVNKDIFKTNVWDSDLDHKYYQSVEHQDFLFSMSHHMKQDAMDKTQKTIIEPSREIIDENIKTGKEFAIYKQVDETITVVAFLPIRNVKNDKTVAYLVSYTDSPSIVELLKDYKAILLTVFFVVLFISIIVYIFLVGSYNLQKELQFDGLTKVFNRKHFMYLVNIDYKKSKLLGNKISIVMMDIDFFKKVNDEYGHQVGDTVLTEMTSIVKTSMREVDYIGRYGGEEFILLINANQEDAKNVVENIRKKIKEYCFCSEEKLNITASFGIAECKESVSLEDTIKNADSALYRSKNEGRNRVSIF